MKIRVFSDIHIDINAEIPLSLDDDAFTLIAGDISGDVNLSNDWVKKNIKNGIFICGNHDPAYNSNHMSIIEQKKFLHGKFPLASNVTFFDESVGTTKKQIGDNIIVVGSTLYTDYKYANNRILKELSEENKYRSSKKYREATVEEINMGYAIRGLNDFRLGKMDDGFGNLKPVTPDCYLEWFNKSFQDIKKVVEENPTKDIIVLTHHCPTPKCISENYVSNKMNASYVSDLEDFIKEHKNIRAWCCGHVHSKFISKLDDTTNQWIICNPRGYENDMEADSWTPNVYIDTDTWEVESVPYDNKEFIKAREGYQKKIRDFYLKYGSLFF